MYSEVNHQYAYLFHGRDYDQQFDIIVLAPTMLEIFYFPTCLSLAEWLVRWTLERAVWVQAVAWVIVFFWGAIHLPLTVPLSTQENKWIPANCQGNLTKCWRKQTVGIQIKCLSSPRSINGYWRIVRET